VRVLLAPFERRASALLAAAAAGAPVQASPPDWLRDAFESRVVVVDATRRSFGLLADGCLDLRVVHGEGRPTLHLLQPGTIFTEREDPAEGRSAFERFAALHSVRIAALSLGLEPDGRPGPLARSAPLDGGDALFVRTLRRELGGGGAVALVRQRGLEEPGGERRTLELHVLALDPARSRLPRHDEGWYALDAGRRSGRIELWPADPFGHPSLGSFDLLRLDRDHLEWSGLLPRGPRLESGRLRAAGLGFERLLDLVRSPDADPRGAEIWRFEELKADALGRARGCDVVVLDAGGEPVQGAWVCARRSPQAGAAAPALYSVQSDDEGRVRLPIDRRDDPAAVELLAFQGGATARFGTRRGAVAAAHAGGECVVLLDRRETTMLRVEPPPGWPCLVGAQFADGSFLLRIGADGRLALPATGDACVVELGPPWVGLRERVDLAPGAAPAIAATLAAGRERRVRFVDARGRDVAGASTGQVAPAGALVALEDGVLAPPGLAGTTIRFRVAAPGFRSRDVELLPDAPRDQEIALDRL